MRALDVARPGQSLGTLRRPGFAQFLPRIVFDQRTSSTDPTPTYTTVATAGSINTKTASWVELVSSTTAEADFLALGVYGTGASAQTGGALIDIAVGGSGTEVIVAANVAIGNMTVGSPGTIVLPLNIPKGSRISAKTQGARIMGGISVNVRLYAFLPGMGLRSPSKLDNIGASTATSGGVSVSLTSNVHTQMTAATDRAYQGFVVMPLSLDGSLSTSVADIAIGVGASGSETLYEGASRWLPSSTETIAPDSTGFPHGFVPCDCPAGSRVTVVFRDTGIAQNSPQVVLMGVPY